MDNQKKSILFVCYGLGIGGIEKCLVNLLNTLPEERWDVDVLLMNAEYAMKPQVKKSAHFVDEFTYMVLDFRTLVQTARARGGLAAHVGKFLRYGVYRVADKLGVSAWRIHGSLPKHYDIAVAYSQNGEVPYYVMDKVTANRKVLWYHNGAYEKTGKPYQLDREYYPRFDYVVAVSNDCARMLKGKFTELGEKLVVLRNICDADDIRSSAVAFVPESFGDRCHHIVTVGRLTPEKGVDLAISACEQLIRKGIRLVWHWVGDGILRDEAVKSIQENGLEDCFLLEGNQGNPYPYILNADVYVQPSYYEAYSTTVTEAKILCRPMVVTDVGGMRDQLTDGKNALIVPVDADAIAEAVAKLLTEGELAERFCRALKQEAYGTDQLKDYEKTVFA